MKSYHDLQGLLRGLLLTYQGMHELLAVCFMTVDRDSIVHSSAGGNTLEDAMAATLDRRFVEHDTFALFLEIMKSAKAFYEWRAEEGPVCQGGSLTIFDLINN